MRDETRSAQSLLLFCQLRLSGLHLTTHKAPDPLIGARACTLGGLGDTWRSRTPQGGRSGTPSVRAERPSLEGRTTSPDPFPSERRVRLVGVGRIVTGAVQSLSCLASQVP